MPDNDRVNDLPPSQPPTREPRRDAAPPMPRWVRTLLVLLAVFVVVVAVLVLTGEHGPSRHASMRTDGSVAMSLHVS